MEAREAQWRSQSNTLFSSTGEVSTPDPGAGNIQKELIDKHKTHTRIWWNIRSLEEYLKHKIIPRGLRVQIFPAWEVSDDYKGMWETGLFQCSKIIINMLLEHDRLALEETKTQIKELETKLMVLDAETIVEPFQTKLKDLLEKYEKEIMNGKKMKFQRDKTDYEQNRAFRWKHRGNPRWANKASGHKSDTAGSESEPGSSDDFLGSSDGEGRPGGGSESHHQKNQKGKTKKVSNKTPRPYPSRSRKNQ